MAEKIGYPVVIRPAFTLGGTGGGFAESREEFRRRIRHALEVSPVHEALIEKSVRGYKEIEYEVIRDANDTAITVCNMENVDPVGIHTGDSIVVCPSQTLTNREYQMPVSYTHLDVYKRQPRNGQFQNAPLKKPRSFSGCPGCQKTDAVLSLIHI